MRVLLIGKGAREHALATKIRRSPLLGRLWLWPGSPVMAPLGEALDVPPDADLPSVVAAAGRARVDLVVSGPEAPLAGGLADAMATAGIPTFGPVRAAAALEASKEFAKRTMARARIPTAGYVIVTTEAACRAAAAAMLAAHGGAVLKASGLAAGKGVFVCRTAADVEAGLARLYHTEMRHAAAAVVVEEVLEGRECSYFAFVGREGVTGLGFAVDYKRLEDGDLGPNTGGMGCYAPVPWLPRDAERQVTERVVEPLLRTLGEDGIPYTGCLYVGLMWSPTRGPQVVEFNVRLGDPEAQVLAAYDDRDWLALMAAKCGIPVPPRAVVAASAPVAHDDRAVAVVMASRSYPFGAGPGDGGEAAGDLPLALFGDHGAVKVFGAGVAAAGPGRVRTGDGRVLTVAARGQTFVQARELAYSRVREIDQAWRGARWRRDIAARVSQETEGS